MNTNALISIIVPVYNAESYLDKCISSILAQTHKNIEVLLVNDGSTDNSLAICREFARKDPRIQVFSQENQGQGAARNVALANATGDYIGFVDADDYIAPHMMETLLEHSLLHDADFVSAGYYQTDPNTEEAKPALHGSYPYDTPIGQEQIHDILRTTHTDGNLLWFCCRNLYRRSVIDRSGLRFFEGKVIEDPLFNLEYLANARCMVLIREPLYYYVMTPNSTIRKPGKKDYLQKLEDSHNLKIGVYQKYGITGFEKSMADYTVNHTLTLLVSNLLDLKEDLRREVLAVINSPMVQTGFSEGTLNSSNTPLLRLFKFLIRHRAAGVCTLLIKIYQRLHKR